MAKRVTFIPGVDAMSGILAGRAGKLVYAENDNKAFEAPQGTNYARNYGARIVLAQRAKDGKAYFSVKTKSATKIDASSKMNMALIGGIAAIKSALKTQQTTDWNTLHTIYEYIKAHQGGIGSFNQWLDPYLRRMLRYHEASVVFTQAVGSVTITNPWNVSNPSALTLVYATWIKFAPMFIFNSITSSVGAIPFTIDGVQMYSPFGASQAPITWEAFYNLGGINANVDVMIAGLQVSTGSVKYNSLDVYSSAGVAQTDVKNIANDKYTTIAPQA